MREPSFNAPTSEHTLLHLQETLEHWRHRVLAGGDTEQAAQSTFIAWEMHKRQLIKEMKP